MLLDAHLPTHLKDGIIFVPGPLTDGEKAEGTRKLKQNVEGFHLAVYDFDKGDAPIELLDERLEDLGLESAMYAVSLIKEHDRTRVAVTKPDPRTGKVETKPSGPPKVCP